jgi:hypothetical protein
MLNISLPNALSIWSDLEAALYGVNNYGGTVAEIYAYRITPLSILAYDFFLFPRKYTVAIRAGFI